MIRLLVNATFGSPKNSVFTVFSDQLVKSLPCRLNCVYDEIKACKDAFCHYGTAETSGSFNQYIKQQTIGMCLRPTKISGHVFSFP